MKFDSLTKESVGFRFGVGILNLVVGSSFWFALLRLFHTTERVFRKERVTVSTFAFCFINSSLLFADGARSQQNQFILALIVLSFSYMIEQQYLMGVFWFCVALNSSHVGVYYSLGYFLYLVIVYGFTPSFRFKNLFKLCSLVIVFHAILYLPFVNQLKPMFSLKTGPKQEPTLPLPNIQTVYSFVRATIEG